MSDEIYDIEIEKTKRSLLNKTHNHKMNDNRQVCDLKSTSQLFLSQVILFHWYLCLIKTKSNILLKYHSQIYKMLSQNSLSDMVI